MPSKVSKKSTGLMRYFISIFFFCWSFSAFSQNNLPGFQFFEEAERRANLMDDSASLKASFLLRMPLNPLQGNFEKKIFGFKPLPILSNTLWNQNRPYGWGDLGMIPAVGLQQYVSAGFQVKASILHVRFQPEVVFAQSKPYQGFSFDFPGQVILDRYYYWNYDDSPELYSDGSLTQAWWGQSSVTLRYGAFETGLSTRSIWWGPGQWGSLTFSNTAKSFPHLTLNTTKPAKTFLGNFEGQLLIGRLENSGRNPSQNLIFDNAYFLPFNGDWRYLNALMVSYTPKWIPNASIGFARTFQQFRKDQPQDFAGYFPIFEPFQKVNLFQNDNSVIYDGLAQDQQVSFSFRYAIPKAKMEFYAEYGRRDHAFNWRDAILSPEHARAYLAGFSKLVDLPISPKKVQIRGEMIHQQESVNRYIRYMGEGGDTSWQLHYQVRSFGNFGQALGTGIGTGSNVQILEIALVDHWNKLGIIFHRLENHMDFYNRAFVTRGYTKPWIDFTVGLLFDHSWNDRFVMSTQLMHVSGINYQWQDYSKSNFGTNTSLASIHARVKLMIMLNKAQKI